ncbi:MAG TPA: hypothetical protein VNG12_03245 [Acidimicrobiales bacterium]|nr:hypothetical protein [Acidimicrobiales bacterium]
MNGDDADDVLAAHEETGIALAEVIESLQQGLTRIQRIREERLSGDPYLDILSRGEGQLLVRTLTENLQSLQRHGHRLRRAEARALRAEGASTARIAELFGVSRQRVLVLLGSEHDQPES